MSICTSQSLLRLAALVGLLSPQAHADLFSYVRVNPGAFAATSAITDFNSSANTPAQVSLAITFGSATFSGSGKAMSDYGVLKAFVTGDLANYPAESFVTACGPNNYCTTSGGDPVEANAQFTDTLTILGGTGPGTLRLRFDVDGSASHTTDLDYLSLAQGALLVQAGGAYVLNTGYVGGTHHFASTSIAFTYGVPFSLLVESSAFLAVTDWDTNASPYNFSGTADFFNTTRLSSVELVTGGVSGASVSSNSGTAYSLSGATASAVPEPSSAGLMVLGLGAAWTFAFLRRKNA